MPTIGSALYLGADDQVAHQVLRVDPVTGARTGPVVEPAHTGRPGLCPTPGGAQTLFVAGDNAAGNAYVQAFNGATMASSSAQRRLPGLGSVLGAVALDTSRLVVVGIGSTSTSPVPTVALVTATTDLSATTVSEASPRAPSPPPALAPWRSGSTTGLH